MQISPESFCAAATASALPRFVCQRNFDLNVHAGTQTLDRLPSMAIGISRIGAILAPTIAGAFIDAQWTVTLYGVFAIPLLIAVVSVVRVRGKAG
jgi:hypothetical protein